MYGILDDNLVWLKPFLNFQRFGAFLYSMSRGFDCLRANFILFRYLIYKNNNSVCKVENLQKLLYLAKFGSHSLLCITFQSLPMFF